VDNYLVVGTKEAVAIAKTQLMARFDCNKIGNMDKYVGCKVNCDFDEDSIKLTQPLMSQSFVDEFPMCMDGRANYTPAIPGDHLVKGDDGTNIGGLMQAHYYQTRAGKLLHMMRWTRPEIQNAVHELPKYMSGATLVHYRAMLQVMNSCVTTLNRGLLLKPNRK
jgi:hypothetical protein